MVQTALAFLALAASATATQAIQNPAFHPGPLFPQYSQVATVETARVLPDNAAFKVAFDIAERADPGELNRALVSATRFIDMHVENGVPEANIQLALVIHGGAVKDLTRTEIYEAGAGEPNANAELVAALLDYGVSIEVCGQSATAQGVSANDLLPGVEMALSAMTAHALLQQDGYTLNPF